MSDEGCGSCRFFALHRENTGTCRARPPEKIAVGLAVVTGWPGVAITDWCGSFEAKRPTADVAVDSGPKLDATTLRWAAQHIRKLKAPQKVWADIPQEAYAADAFETAAERMDSWAAEFELREERKT